MNPLTLTLNGIKVRAKPGETILEVARREGISIPTLCHETRLEPFGSCRVCLVKVEGAKAYVPSCSTKVAEGMNVSTESPEIAEARYLALSLLISEHYGDCVSPCSVKCPARIDIQGYIALVNAGDPRGAVRLIKEKNPLPLSIGRVCPHTCETVCRRKGVEEPIAINNLKRYAADRDMESASPFMPDMNPRSGVKVAVVGSGPAGLSAAYYLARDGYDVTVFEKLGKPGGMLRYGIPEYRLPKEVLDREIGLILAMGVRFRYETALGRDFSIDDLKREGYRSVFIGVGAWRSMALRIGGEELPNVRGGIQFLHDVASGKRFDFTGKTVMVIGGGNTAMDAARTSVRLGASSVTVLYRRTKAEMPANEIEIEEAEEEGVVFQYLAAPVGIAPLTGGRRGEASDAPRLEVECIRMELGKPDDSGRRRPVPVEDSNFKVAVDVVITAVGQVPDVSCVGDRALLTARDTVKAGRESGATDDDFVFAGGDCVTGAATAIEAIAAGRTAAESIDLLLRTGVKRERPDFAFNISKGEVGDVAAEYFARYEKTPRAVMTALDAGRRVKGFEEIEKGLTDAQARSESARCLECGCAEGFRCALRDNSTLFAVNTGDFAAPRRSAPGGYNDIVRHPPISRDEGKCIKCGICVRICDEVWGLHIYGFTSRGSDTRVQPSFGRPLAETECDLCGQCADACPTGALSLGTYLPKPGPFKVEKRAGICILCGLGCAVEYNVYGGELVRVTSSPGMGENEGNLCVRGRFGYGYLGRAERAVDYRLFENGGEAGRPVSRETALDESAKLLRNARRAAVVTSAQLSDEELEAVRALADGLPGSRLYHLSHDFGERAAPIGNGGGPGAAEGGGIPLAGMPKALADLIAGVPAPSLSDFKSCAVVLVFAVSPGRRYPVLEMHIRRAAQRGAKLFVVNDGPLRLNDHADGVFRARDALSGGTEAAEFLDLLARAVDSGAGGGNTLPPEGGREAAAACLSRMGVKPRKVSALVRALAGPGKAILVTDGHDPAPNALESFVRLAKACGSHASLLVMRRGMNGRAGAHGDGNPDASNPGAARPGASGRLSAGEGRFFSRSLLEGADAFVLFKTPKLTGLPPAPAVHVGFKPYARYGARSVFVPSSSLLETGGRTTIYNGKTAVIPPILKNGLALDNLDYIDRLTRELKNV